MTESGFWGRTTAPIRNVWRRKAIAVSRHYKPVFGEGVPSPRDREVVIADLREFCRAREGGFSQDALVMARNAGRREVFLRIMHLTGLDEAEVNQMMEVDSGY